MGFQRLAVDRAAALVDAGLPSGVLRDDRLRYGALSFEFSVGPSRLVVNHATAPDFPDWPSNSCFTVEGQGAADFQLRRPGKASADRIKCRRHEDEENSVWLEAAHGGFQSRFGVFHQRRFFLDGDASNLRGEDVLLRANEQFADGRACAALFYLHPDVQASALQGGGAVILRLPAGGGWQFRADGGEIALHDARYLANPGEERRCRLIAVTARTKAAGTKIRWVFHRL